MREAIECEVPVRTHARSRAYSYVLAPGACKTLQARPGSLGGRACWLICWQSEKPLEGEAARPAGSEACWRQAGPCLGWVPALVDAAQEGASSADADSPAKRGGAKRAQEHVAMGAAASQPLAHCPRPCKRVRVKHRRDAWVRALDAEVFVAVGERGEDNEGDEGEEQGRRLAPGLSISRSDEHAAGAAAGLGQSWKAGDEVEALYRKSTCSGWHLAVIACLDVDGTFLLNWDDGDRKDRHKTARQIRRRS